MNWLLDEVAKVVGTLIGMLIVWVVETDVE